MSHQRHLLDYHTARRTQAELKAECKVGKGGRIYGVDMSWEGNKGRELQVSVCGFLESLAEYSWVGWDSTKLSKGQPAGKEQLPWGCKINNSHYTWLGDMAVLTRHGGKNSQNTHGASRRGLWKIGLTRPRSTHHSRSHLIQLKN